MQVVKQPVTLESFKTTKKYWKCFSFQTSYGLLWFMGGKLMASIEGTTNWRWEELNKETCMFTKQLPRCTSVRKYKLMKLLTFILTQKYAPCEKQPTHFFTELWKFHNFKQIKEKDWHYTNFIYYWKWKIWLNIKSRKTFVCYDFDCFFYSFYYFNDANRLFDS